MLMKQDFRLIKEKGQIALATLNRLWNTTNARLLKAQADGTLAFRGEKMVNILNVSR